MNQQMLNIDGSIGEGGGQIVRSSLTLSMVTGIPVTIDRIRAGRDKPGLRRQHATGVRAAAKVCRGQADGCEIGSSRLVFEPEKIGSGDYHFDIGTAGSTTLVLQTVLPALFLSDGPSQVTLEGGTHNPFAPPFEFLTQSYLPILDRIGMSARATLDRPGFYPAGGGRMSVMIQPMSQVRTLSLLERGKALGRRVRAIVSNLPRSIAERECDTIARNSGWSKDCFDVIETDGSAGPGNVVLIELEFEHVSHVVVGFGKRGLSAEKVASQSWKAAKLYLDGSAPIGGYLADQLVLPLAISAHLGGEGGEFRTSSLSNHTTTHLKVVKMFMDLDIEVRRECENDYVVRIGKAQRG